MSESTLLCIIAGLEPPTSGCLSLSKALCIGYLDQKADQERCAYFEKMSLCPFTRTASAAAPNRTRDDQPWPPRGATERDAKFLQIFELAGGLYIRT